MEPNYEMDKLSYEIFSILENKFLFSGSGNSPANSAAGAFSKSDHGKVRILSIDGGGDGILAGASIARLEASLRLRSGDPDAAIADFFDVAAGSGAGGILAAGLFTRGSDGKPLLTAEKSLRLLSDLRRRRRDTWRLFRRSAGSAIEKTFDRSLTLRDTLKPVLIPCYDLSTGSPFLFSRADAMETDCYDFRIGEICAATCTDRAVRMRSVDARTAILAVGGSAATTNPTAAAITHVLNNKQEFPFANGVEDLLVVSIGSSESESEFTGRNIGTATPSRKEMARIAESGAADMVDQAVALAFENSGSCNYVRIQGYGTKICNSKKAIDSLLTQRNVKSVLFRGKKVNAETNAEKLEWFSGELITEQERRRTSRVPTVLLKQVLTPRTSSATASTIITSTSTGASTSP